MNAGSQTGTDRCVACRTLGSGYFCSIKGPYACRIQGERVEERYGRGEIIFREGDPATALHCIRRGVVKLSKMSRGGDEVLIRLLGPGDIMGYRPLLADDAFAATATVLETTVMCALPRRVVMEILRDYPDVSMRLLKKLAVELRESEEQMVRRVLEPVPQRTARFLLWLAESRVPGTTGRGFETLLRQDMAMVVGTTPETFSRVLRDFEQRGILTTDGRTIRVVDVEVLRAIAGGGGVEKPSRQ